MPVDSADGRARSERLSTTGRVIWPARAPLLLLVADPHTADRRAVEAMASRDTVEVVSCENGAEALFLIGQVNPDIILLSATLPRIPVRTVITVLRAYRDTPVYLGIHTGEAEMAGPGLAAGATGVVSRPYQWREFESLLADRIARGKARLEQQAVIEVGALELDSLAFEARANGEPLELTLKEFELLRYLMLHVDVVVPSDELRKEVWGSRGQSATNNTIAVHVGRLRARLAGSAELLTIRGLGYRLTLRADH
jgi:two-component system OmpR family response regulator